MFLYLNVSTSKPLVLVNRKNELPCYSTKYFPRISYQHAIGTYDDFQAPNGALAYFFIHDYRH